MVPEKQSRRYKQINFIGFQNNHHPSQHTAGNVAAIQEAVLRSIRKEAFADCFQKLY
jgi:hypothetical protein